MERKGLISIQNIQYKIFIYAIILISCIFLLIGCGLSDTTINPEEISEEQFIEIVSPDGVVLCQVVGKNAIIDFIQNEKMEEWEEVSEIPVQAKLQYIITSYEKVTEEVWRERGAPEISIGEEKLYEYNGKFYIEAVLGDYAANYCIPVSAGEYMVELALNVSDSLDKNEIFASWDINPIDEENEEKADAKDSDQGLENQSNKHTISADELAKVSKEQKLEIFCEESGIVCTMTDLEEIAEFYNQIKYGTWLEIEHLPKEKSNVCEITTYQLERHTAKKNFIENEQLILFEAQSQYYMLNVIPSHSSEIDDMEICYSIPDDIAGYIKKLANLN